MRDPELLGPADPVEPQPAPPPDASAAPRAGRRWSAVPVVVEPTDAAPPAVRYQWDADTEILAASVVDRRGGGAAASAMEIQSRDGAWLTVELRAGRVCGLEIAIWPTVRMRSTLTPPEAPVRGHVAVPAVQAVGAAADVEVDALIGAEADRRERTFHFRLGRVRPTRAVQVGRDILLDVDEAGELAGLWLLNVPPLPLPL